MIELFCRQSGMVRACTSAGLSACGIGFRAVGLPNRPCLDMDLLLDWTQEFVLQLIACRSTDTIVWCSVPCGTFSRAREKCSSSKRLRSLKHPLGLPAALVDDDFSVRMENDNNLARFMLKVIKLCNERQLRWYACGSGSSYVWDIHEWSQYAYTDVRFASCAYGGGRPNGLRVRGCDKTLCHLAAECPGNHSHKPWNWSGDKSSPKTAADRADLAPPKAFLAQAAACLANTVGLTTAPTEGLASVALTMAKSNSIASDENKIRVAKLSSSAGWQSRGKRLEQIIAEHKEIMQVPVPKAQYINLKRRQRIAKSLHLAGRTVIPAESQVLDLGDPVRGNTGDESTKVTFGCPWSPSEFLARALELEHPFAAAHCPDATARAIFKCLTKGPKETRKHRAACFKRWRKLAKELEPKEKELCASLHPDVAPFALAKRPLLTHALLVEAEFPAADLVLKYLTEGWPMFGPFPCSEVFPKRKHERTLSREELLKTGKWAVHAIMGTAPFATPPEVAAALRAATDEELQNDECRGPFSKEQMDARHPHGWVPCVRFPVSQKGKVRPCDDYAKYGQNGTSEADETVDTEGVDSITAVARLWASAVDDQGNVRIVLSDGTVLEGKVHPSLTRDEILRLFARIIDLARAYKQLARRPEDADFAIFAMQDEHGVWQFFEAVALGFGARDAVLSFNLMARGLRHILNILLWIAATHFYDDFSQIEPEAFAVESCQSTEDLFNLLGWSFKDAEDQLRPTAQTFAPLGVQMDFSRPGFVTVMNTAKRLARMQEDIAHLRSLETPQPSAFASLLGVSQFAEAQTCGRTGSLILKEVRIAARDLSMTGRKRLHSALDVLAKYFQKVKPRSIRLTCSAPPIVILTDAAAEDSGSSLGAVFVDPVSKSFEFFGKKIADSMVSYWRRCGKRQIICQAELVAVPLALQTWKANLQNRDVLFFVDNEPAREALIRGSSAADDSSHYVTWCRLLCAEVGAAVWYARVASPSNISDGPSRGSFSSLIAAGARWREPSHLDCEHRLGLSDF